MTTKEEQHHLPKWEYHGVDPQLHSQREGETAASLPQLYTNDDNDDANDTFVMKLGDYKRPNVSNLDVNATGRAFFDQGLRLMLSYQHEMASKCFLASLKYSPHCALAHGLVALCHSPNYNFKGEPYYLSAHHVEDEDVDKPDHLCVFPSQQVADRHSKMGVDTIEECKRLHNKSSNSNTPNKRGKKGKGKNKHKGSSSNSSNSNKNTQQSTSSQSTTADDSPATAAIAVPDLISHVEVQLLHAIRLLTGHPGVDPDLSEETVGRPYAQAMQKVYTKYGATDPEVVYCYCEALMVLNAWQLYEYPSGRPVSPDVLECKSVLEKALFGSHRHDDDDDSSSSLFKHHAGLCHLYVHLSEMSATPEMALPACQPLRSQFPHAGHLIHMATHIDVLLGDYAKVVRYNRAAVVADGHVRQISPATAGPESFYFGYIVHNYHMAVYGAILGGMQQAATTVAAELCAIVNESMLQEFPSLAPYLESYSALDIHVMIRFGQWKELLIEENSEDAAIKPPRDAQLMLYRAASLAYGKGLAYATLSSSMECCRDDPVKRQEYLRLARKQADRLDGLRGHPDAEFRILHNNSVADLLAVDACMMRGEIAYHTAAASAADANDNSTESNDSKSFDPAFDLLTKAVKLQDSLNYDEPWGKMQPVRHALGGLLLEQGRFSQARRVFEDDLKFHPKNPWALVGLISCLERLLVLQESSDVSGGGCCSKKVDSTGTREEPKDEADSLPAAIATLKEQLRVQQAQELADFDVVVPCECCCKLKTEKS